MTIAGDMAAYVSSKAPGIDMPTARVVIALALEAADDHSFATRFSDEYEFDNDSPYGSYLKVVQFLKAINR